MKCYKFKYLIIVFLLISSCAGVQKYYNQLESFMLQDNQAAAETLATASKDAYGEKNELLYYLDVGMLSHFAQKYKESNSAFEEAKRIYDANYTKSISSGLFSLFTNDNTVPYYGEPYEMAYTSIFCALNYIMLGMNNESVVEARQIDNLFKKTTADSKGKAFYTDDGFVRYLMGIVYENAGYFNDAVISYKLAIKAYQNNIYIVPIPEDLINDLYTLYYNLGMGQEAYDLKSKYPTAKRIDSPHTGELVIIDYNGLAPKKIENIIELSFYKAWPYFNSAQITNEDQAKAAEVRSVVQAGFSDDYIKVSFPKYYRYNNQVTSFAIEQINKENNVVSNEIKSYMVTDIGTLLENALEKKNAFIYARTIARAVGRYVLTKTVSDSVKKQSNNESLGILTKSLLNIATSYMEKADTRSWRTLPENINMIRTRLQTGTYDMNINYLDNYSNVVSSKRISVIIQENKKTFILVNSFINYKGNIQNVQECKSNNQENKNNVQNVQGNRRLR
ncbi:MAG: hypothetical protein PHG84_03625 [Endomicrobiaceae bacterium]|nr:hypothetical protein [Endomicrobiaceae bacterium]